MKIESWQIDAANAKDPAWFGDLNDDGLKDCVLIVKKSDTTNIVTNRSDKRVDRNRRGIIVLFKIDKGYQLADQNLDCLICGNEAGRHFYYGCRACNSCSCHTNET